MFVGISLNQGPQISYTLLGIIGNHQVPTGADFILVCEHPFSTLWSKTGLKSQKIKQFRTIFTLYIQVAFCTMAVASVHQIIISASRRCRTGVSCSSSFMHKRVQDIHSTVAICPTPSPDV
jgi:hypothetical protein